MEQSLFLHFCTFQPNTKDPTEGGGRQDHGNSHCPIMANSKLVAMSTEPDLRAVLPSSKSSENLEATPQTRQDTSTNKDEPRVFSYIRKALRRRGIPKQARDLILKSWRTSTKRQYNSYITKWFSFCGQTISPLRPNINHVLKFLAELYNKGLQYRSLGTARSAISTFLKICSNIDINKYEEVTRFMKGVFIERPALPRYTTTWSVDTVLKYLESSTVFVLQTVYAFLITVSSEMPNSSLGSTVRHKVNRR